MESFWLVCSTARGRHSFDAHRAFYIRRNLSARWRRIGETLREIARGELLPEYVSETSQLHLSFLTIKIFSVNGFLSPAPHLVDCEAGSPGHLLDGYGTSFAPGFYRGELSRELRFRGAGFTLQIRVVLQRMCSLLVLTTSKEGHTFIGAIKTFPPVSISTLLLMPGQVKFPSLEPWTLASGPGIAPEYFLALISVMVLAGPLTKPALPGLGHDPWRTLGIAP